MMRPYEKLICFSEEFNRECKHEKDKIPVAIIKELKGNKGNIGFCAGFVTRFFGSAALSEHKGEAKGIREDLTQLRRIQETIRTWTKDTRLSAEEAQEIRTYLLQIRTFQYASEFSNQGALDKVVFFNTIPGAAFTREFQITDDFTVGKLKILLGRIHRRNRMIYYCSFRHATGSYNELYSDNMRITTISSLDSLTEAIFNSHSYYFPNTVIALHLCIFAPLNAKEEKHLNAIEFLRKFPYPRIKHVAKLFIAVLLNDITSLQYHLPHARHLINSDQCEKTLLFIAAQEGHIEAAHILLAAGARVDYPDAGGSTALFIAIQREHIDVMRLLLSAGANVNHTNSFGETPLIEAVNSQCKEAVELLLSKGADVFAKTKCGYTVFTLSRTPEITQLINDAVLRKFLALFPMPIDFRDGFLGHKKILDGLAQQGTSLERFAEGYLRKQSLHKFREVYEKNSSLEFVAFLTKYAREQWIAMHQEELSDIERKINCEEKHITEIRKKIEVLSHEMHHVEINLSSALEAFMTEYDTRKGRGIFDSNPALRGNISLFLPFIEKHPSTHAAKLWQSMLDNRKQPLKQVFQLKIREERLKLNLLIAECNKLQEKRRKKQLILAAMDTLGETTQTPKPRVAAHSS